MLEKGNKQVGDVIKGIRCGVAKAACEALRRKNQGTFMTCVAGVMNSNCVLSGTIHLPSSFRLTALYEPCGIVGLHCHFYPGTGKVLRFKAAFCLAGNTGF